MSELDRPIVIRRDRPYEGQTIGQISEPTKKQGRDWEPPKVPMEAPKECQEAGFSQTTCFDCIRPTCIFDDQPERVNRKWKKTKTQLRQEGLLPPLERKRKRQPASPAGDTGPQHHRPPDPDLPAQA